VLALFLCNICYCYFLRSHLKDGENKSTNECFSYVCLIIALVIFKMMKILLVLNVCFCVLSEGCDRVFSSHVRSAFRWHYAPAVDIDRSSPATGHGECKSDQNSTLRISLRFLVSKRV
jgi:hypothetical protein